MQNKLVVLIVLSSLAFFSLIYGIVTPSKYRRGPVSTPAPGQQESGRPLMQDLILLERHAKRSHLLYGGRNPFLPEGTVTESFSSLALNGIAWDDENPRAAINDRIVGVGDEVDGRVVVDILQNKVILDEKGKRVELRLGQQK